MWNPADSLDWQRDAICALPENRESAEWFFSQEFEDKYAAKNLCHSCPVRSDCLQWALEHKQIWGIWGGRDEIEIRRALSVSFTGEEMKRQRPPHCPHCSAWPSKLSVSVEHLPNGGRWKTAKVVTCSECGFSWRSRTSANAVDSYHSDRAEKARKKKEAAEAAASATPSGTTPSLSLVVDPQEPAHTL